MAGISMAPINRARTAGTPQAGSAQPQPHAASLRNQTPPPQVGRPVGSIPGPMPGPVALGPGMLQPTPQSGDPTLPGMGAPPMGQQPPDPTQSAIWQAFPSTDPQILQQFLGSALSSGNPGDVASAIGLVQQLQQHDEEQLYQRGQQALQMLIAQLSAPTGDPQGAAPQQAPFIGGENTGSYA